MAKQSDSKKQTVPISGAPRSVSDATRFTATTPHASSKHAAAKLQTPIRKAPPSSPGIAGAGAAAAAATPTPTPTSTPGGMIETPEQKVARLRAAHQKAKLAQVSKLDQVIDLGRKTFDRAHRVTVLSLVGFTAIAGLVTVYTAVDMMTYNKKRKAEWIEAQRKLEADSLDAARLAYMTGKATEEQIALVEEQLEKERRAGTASSFFEKMPPILAPASSSSSSSSASAADESSTRKPSVTESVSWPAESTPSDASKESKPEEKSKSAGGVWAWLTSNLKKEEEGDSAPLTSERRLGWESLSEEDDGAGVRDSDLVRAVEGKKQYLRQKAAEAFEREKENERKGGPLDQVGLDQNKMAAAEAEKPKKKWWSW